MSGSWLVAQGNIMDYVYDSENGKRYTFPTHINELIVDRADAEVSEVFMVIVEPEKATHLHRHTDVEQIFYILEGEGVLTIGPDKKEYEVKPTQVVRIPPDTLHTIRASGTQPMRYLCVDCFGNSNNSNEPTWESHVKQICREQGYTFDDVAGD